MKLINKFKYWLFEKRKKKKGKPQTSLIMKKEENTNTQNKK